MASESSGLLFGGSAPKPRESSRAAAAARCGGGLNAPPTPALGTGGLDLHLIDHVVVRLELLLARRVLRAAGHGVDRPLARALVVLVVLHLLLRALELPLHLVDEEIDRREDVLVLDLRHLLPADARGRDHLD